MFTETAQAGRYVSVRREDQVAQIRSIADRIARSYGVEIFDVQLRREPIGWVLRVILDRRLATASCENEARETINLADCKRVSEDLSAVLDVDVSFDFTYTLEVSSPGLDRPLRHLDDCRRFVGRLATIITTEAVDGQRYLAGRITGVEREQVVIATDKQRIHRIPWPLVTRARLDVEF